MTFLKNITPISITQYYHLIGSNYYFGYKKIYSYL